MKHYYAVEVTRTATERRTIIVCANDSDIAHDVAVQNAESERVRAPLVNPRTNYSIDQTTQIARPEYVDVMAYRVIGKNPLAETDCDWEAILRATPHPSDSPVGGCPSDGAVIPPSGRRCIEGGDLLRLSRSGLGIASSGAELSCLA
jgi:hypothetical protein